MFARQDEVSLRVEEDVIKVSVEAEKNDSLDQLYVSVNFYQFETPAPKDSPSFDTYILPGRSEIMQSRNRISRFLKIEGDTTIALPKEIFEDIPTDNIWINVTKGRMTKSIINNQEFVVLNLSRDGKRFKLEK